VPFATELQTSSFFQELSLSEPTKAPSPDCCLLQARTLLKADGILTFYY